MVPDDAQAIREVSLPPMDTGTTFLFEVRPWHAGDRDFVVPTWLNANGRSALGHALGPSYIHEHRAIVEHVLADPDARVVVAHVPGDEDALLGFAVMAPAIDRDVEAELVHYVYVRKDLRRHGIARKMLASTIGKRVIYTHRPWEPELALRAIPQGWTFNPYFFLTRES